MPREHVIGIDPFKPLAEEPETGHNRWHEDIEPVVEVDPGDTVVYETRDAFDGQLDSNSTAENVSNLDLNVVHPLTGPVYVKGAEQGDLLEVELVEIEADPWEQWGYTVEVPGFGFLRDEFPDPYIIHWRLHGNEYAESEQLPGVRIRCNPHPGTLGLAPGAELRQRAAEREAALAERGGFALLPDPDGAVPFRGDPVDAAEPLGLVAVCAPEVLVHLPRHLDQGVVRRNLGAVEGCQPDSELGAQLGQRDGGGRRGGHRFGLSETELVR